jgi:S-adenosylmethionine decarboxylase
MRMRLFVVLAILSSCPAGLLNDDEYLDRMLRSAIRKSNLTLLSTYMKRFQPQGVTGVAILGESHIAVHSWPEQGKLFLDIATCSTKESAAVAFNEILAHFPGGSVAFYQELEVTSYRAS